MEKRYDGLDFLRGLGIFFVAGLHSAFYYFGGLYDLDLNDPPPIVTVIGLLLMFAGMFAIISGISHGLGFFRRSAASGGKESVFIPFLVRGLVILAVAYIYFIFTGPGIVDMAARTMDNSILVDLIRYGRFPGFSLQRLLYIDSLVMIGTNIILLGLVLAALRRIIPAPGDRRFARSLLVGAVAVTALSLVRIPLYEVYMRSVESRDYLTALLLNGLVNKNNPILPFFAFALYGVWIGALLQTMPWKALRNRVLPPAAVLLAAGAAAYVNLPDTMLQRGIDLKWYSIMIAQLGLFMLMILGALRVFDFRAAPSGKRSFLTRFITRFGVAGLTVFFLESIVSACVYRLLSALFPGLSLTIGQALAYGFSLAVLWGIFLIFWEKTGYRFGLEYIYARIVSRRGGSTKGQKLEEGKKV